MFVVTSAKQRPAPKTASTSGKKASAHACTWNVPRASSAEPAPVPRSGQQSAHVLK